ncbi:hypothetical protein C8R41DRAFT_562915 [Lentinula lateritia]|uniref:MYND-type domain-containing protein n=1 Tax=Lentinula lateritia TaxID=40482 RepID=A0ABQ8V594_9AGAR|nr:hypothetical protein C8R41DRAFT_562915 [Lentinula lateritia]
MNAEQEQIGGTEDMWKETPGLFFMHSVALARSRTDDNKTKETLSRIINDKNIDKGSQGMIFLVKSKMRNHMSNDSSSGSRRILTVCPTQRSWRYSPDNNIKEDPILAGLGGEKWLNNCRHTHKTDIRLTRVRRHCQAREPQCSRCRHVFYCSRECQILHLPYHKRVLRFRDLQHI